MNDRMVAAMHHYYQMQYQTFRAAEDDSPEFYISGGRTMETIEIIWQ